LKVTHIPEKKWQDLSNEEIGGKRDNTVCLIRYGGFGDLIQISSIFPLLKEQGKKVCVNVTENGLSILKNDPHIDELLVQKTDQIPNEELGPYWKRLRRIFPSVINLGGIVEQGLLAIPSDPIYKWPTEKRHKKLNKNYAETLHNKARVPHVFKTKFYPSASEKKWVAEQRRNMRLGSGHYVVVVALSGSSVHKSYPYIDAIIACYLSSEPLARFVLVGDKLCQMLEIGWEKEDRVFCRSGKWSIRETLAFTQQADLVVGPETGVLNSVSAEDTAKVALLSHSSEENLTKHWVNTTAVTPDIDCYPCHKLHYGFDSCNRHEETGGAMCAATTDPKRVVDAIDYHWNLRNDLSRTLSNG
jgi:ADP-heptose:LPS heptosyltransferase